MVLEITVAMFSSMIIIMETMSKLKKEVKWA